MRAPLKRFQRTAEAALLALSFLVAQSAHADWSNFGTISMTDVTHPKLTNAYGCYTDGRDILCDSAASATNFGSGGLIDLGGLTVAGSISSAAVSTTYVSATVLQMSPSTMPCSGGLGGAIRYNAGSMEYCDGVGPAWKQFANGGQIQGDRIVSGTTSVVANNDASVTFATGGTQQMILGTNGKLGIGTSTPDGLLTVSATTSNNSAVAQFGNGGDMVAINDKGQMSLGQWPALRAMLDIRGIDWNNGNIPVDPLILSDAGSTPFFYAASNKTIGVDIGLATPSATVDISGTLKVAGTGAEACDGSHHGVIRVNPADGSLELCRH